MATAAKKGKRTPAAKKSKKTPATRKTARKRAGKTVRKKKAGAPAEVVLIQGWTTDPLGGSPPFQVAAPALPGASLPTRIVDPAQTPKPRVYALGSGEFRYWTAAEAMRRSAAFWSEVGNQAWNPDVGASLPVRLDDGVDLNAYYARNDFPAQDIKQGLSFFHDTVRDVASGQDVTVFSGESPDVVAHELGHAVLDALKPALWGLASTEAAAFHESFGDMSAVLTALQVPQVRQAVVEETTGRLARNSTVSRVAEQLGFAIRQRRPSAVDPDSLRNAANSFVYIDPITLPPSGPASGLSRAPHSFSRVFTGAFLEALGGMASVRAGAGSPGGDDVLAASLDLGRLLVRAVINAPVRTRFFQAVAEQLVLADADLFDGRYGQPLTTAFVRRGLQPLSSLAAPAAAAARSHRRAVAAAALSAATAAGGVDAAGAVTTGAEPVQMVLDGRALGLPVANLIVQAPAFEDVGTGGFAFGIAADAGGAGRQADARAFCETVIVHGRMAGESPRARVASITEAATRNRVTHRLVAADGGLRLERVAIDCCFCCG